LKVLFSPSEAKSSIAYAAKIDKNSFCFPELYDKRLYIVKIYIDFLQKTSVENLKKFFGLKNESECIKYRDTDLLNSATSKVIERYSGVAYNYLDYPSLRKDAKDWIDKNTIIFSNLFGPLKADDLIPLYKYKQNSTINGFKPELFYKEHFSTSIDSYLKDDVIVDLRASFYEKFYKIKQPYITLKFIKNSKVVSHWAKAYRGLVLRYLAMNKVNSIKDFESINFQNLKITEILERGYKKEYIFEICT